MRDKPLTPKIMNYSQLMNMSIEELRSLNEMVISTIKMKKHEVAMETKSELRVGLNVSVNHPKLMGKQLRVERINRTKAVLSDLSIPSYGRQISYTVPLSMIQING
jgi:hypothetical protein